MQTYPDLREFPDGPLEQPYDAAGWTLPYQMGVRVVAAGAPLGDDVRSAMTLVEGETADWKEGELGRDAAPFDSVPGLGFDTHANAAGILPPAGSLTGSGPALAVDAGQNNAYRAINDAWEKGARVALDGSQFVVTGLSDAAMRELVDRYRLRASRAREGRTHISRPRIGLYRPWNPSMDEGWTRWLFEIYEGYYLEFERFNPHPENEKLIPALSKVDSLYTDKGSPELGFQATVLWLYYDDLAASQSFYENVMGFELIVDQGWAKVFPASKSGFIGLVDGARGMHEATRDKAVTVSFLTDDVDAWFTHMKSQEALQAFELRHKEVLDEGFVHVFVGYDPENYFLEFDQFVEHEDNVDFLRILAE